MEQWRAELARKPLAMSEADACAALGLKPSDSSEGGVVSEEEMRRAYKLLARRCAGRARQNATAYTLNRR